MRVLFFSYPASFQNVGGGEIVLLKLKEYLEKAGVEVRLFDMWKDRVEDYDLLHVFGSVKDCLGLVRVARARGVKVAISPVFWSDWNRAFFTYGTPLERAELVARHASKLLFPAFPSARRSLLLASDLVFPNSEMEKEQLRRLFGVPRAKMSVVPNGVDGRFAGADPGPFRSRYGGDPFVLGVGRIEPRKNQLNLIRAVKGMGGMKLVLIGSPVSGFEQYAEACRREGEGFTTFIPAVGHEDPLLASAYAASGVFVLQGWFETPGLVALEAALAGAKVAATSGGSTREYFGDLVDYFNPASPEDMRRAIRAGLGRAKDDRLKNRVLGSFTWDRVALSYVQSYKEALAAPA